MIGENNPMKELLKKKIAFIKAHPRLDLVILLAGVAVFVTIALFNVSNASFWFDEAFGIYLIQFNFIEVAQFTATDVHPPLYYWILKVWAMLFGTTELALRSLSILFGAGVVVTTFFLTRRMFGRLVAGVSLLFLTLSPMLIRYSDEARMYTLAALIVMLATYVLVKATETNQRRWFVLYGILVGLGMWTHYFTALAWIAHWVWRAIVSKQTTTKPKLFWKKLLTKNWIIAHVIAVGMFIPWVPLMISQFRTIQNSGFWIGPISPDSIVNYFSNVFYYLEHGQSQGWLALLLIGVLTIIVALTSKAYRSFKRADKQNYLLIAALAFVPIILLVLASLPPLRPLFVERYLVPASIAFAVFAAVTLVVGSRKWRPVLRAVPIVLVAGMMIFGITNVYRQGNYNKNSGIHILTRELVQDIASKSEPGVPIVANSPWIFYEAVAYSSEDHPVYFIDANTEYIYGSLAMLKERDLHKITDIEAFEKEHPVIWYIGVTGADDVPAYDESWQKIRTTALYDALSDKADYRGTQYRISAE
jgi:mannosyltransferase